MSTPKTLTATIRTPYQKHDRSQLTFVGESRTHQSMKDDCDINLMMKRFRRTGEINRNPNQPQYIDLINANDFNDATRLIKQAQNTFDDLPSDIRRSFNNDPSRFLEAVESGDLPEHMAQPLEEPLNADYGSTADVSPADDAGVESSPSKPKK